MPPHHQPFRCDLVKRLDPVSVSYLTVTRWARTPYEAKIGAQRANPGYKCERVALQK